jgi:hypothetical protein
MGTKKQMNNNKKKILFFLLKVPPKSKMKNEVSNEMGMKERMKLTLPKHQTK